MGNTEFNEQLDLRFERKVSCPVEHLWKGWTDPATLKKWFCPRPWRVTDCSIDLQPGGRFWNLMEGPQGEHQEGDGCYLEILPLKRLVWTSALLTGFRPAPVPAMGFSFTVILEFESVPDGSIFRATVSHRTEEDRKTHESMGFHLGWSIALDQLLELNR